MIPFNFSFWKTSGIIGNGSILFTAASQNYLTVPASQDWAVETGDFNIEWFHYQTNNGNENYIFDLGISDTFALSVSSGGNNLRLHMNGGLLTSVTNDVSTNIWTHIAISRSSGTLRIFQDGNQKYEAANSTNITASQSTLHIGCKDPANPTGDHFPGNITNFRWIKGSAVYTGTFSKPTSNLTSTIDTKLLLLSQNSNLFLKDSSSLDKTVTNFGTTFSSLTPFI